MKRLSFIYVALLATLVGCKNQSNQEFTRYYEDGRAKPSIVLAPIIDTTSFDLSWSLSEEFHQLLIHQFAGQGNLYVNEDTSSYLTSAKNPFGEDLNWVKQEYSPNEFVIFMEFIQHDQTPAKAMYDPTENVSTNLNMAIRLRMIDIRGSSPKVVLQQVLKDSYYFPKSLLPIDYEVTTWGTENYPLSPLGTAHIKFAHTLANRLNDYVLLAKSRWDG